MYEFVCEGCGGTFTSKTDPSTWRKRLCNNCRGNKFASNNGGSQPQQVRVQQVPTSKQQVSYNNVATTQHKQAFDYAEHFATMVVMYQDLKALLDANQITIPEESICAWVTGAIIEKNKRG